MASSAANAARSQPGKRGAILLAARDVFGRTGYARSSIDAIADAADVSTRTIYNHFEGKERLFSEVLQDSATQVADGFIASVARTVRGADLVEDLLAIGTAFAAQETEHPEHFAMVGQIQVERRHFPKNVIAAWRRAGPLRVQEELARRLGEMADRGVLLLDDPRRAAIHFSVLVTATIPADVDPAAKPSKRQRAETVNAGVAAFLRGYEAR